MKPITEHDHPEHGTYKWTRLELAWINARIKSERKEERERCASVCLDMVDGQQYAEAIRALGDVK